MNDKQAFDWKSSILQTYDEFSNQAIDYAPHILGVIILCAVIGMFEDTIAKYTALAILLPIATGQSGNTGAQALAVTMRGLTLPVKL